MSDIFNLNELAAIIGILFMVLATLLCGAIAVAVIAELIVRKFQVSYWVAMYALHRKEFREWVKRNASPVEKVLLDIDPTE